MARFKTRRQSIKIPESFILAEIIKLFKICLESPLRFLK